MAIEFYNKQLDIPKSDYCLILDSDSEKKLVKVPGKSFDFHKQTRLYFKGIEHEPEMTEICHCYSFSCIETYLCNCFTASAENKINWLEMLLEALYIVDNVVANAGAADAEGYKTAFNLCRLVSTGSFDSPEDEEFYYNMLLYVLNNARTNLHWGYENPNCSLKDAYDPISYEYDKDNGRFLITDPRDVFRIETLLNVQFKRSTLFFYTAELQDGDDNKRILYSSSYADFTSTDKYSVCTSGIALKTANEQIINLDLTSGGGDDDEDKDDKDSKDDEAVETNDS